jgi:predicted solute-binding protein
MLAVEQDAAERERATATVRGAFEGQDVEREAFLAQAAIATGVPRESCLEYFAGLDYRLSYPHLAGLTEFFRRLVLAGRVPDGTLAFLPAA